MAAAVVAGFAIFENSTKLSVVLPALS